MLYWKKICSWNVEIWALKFNFIFTLFFIVILFSGTVAPYMLIDADALKSKGTSLPQYGSSTNICGLELCSDYPGGRAAFTQYMANFLNPTSMIVPDRGLHQDNTLENNIDSSSLDIPLRSSDNIYTASELYSLVKKDQCDNEQSVNNPGSRAERMNKCQSQYHPPVTKTKRSLSGCQPAGGVFPLGGYNGNCYTCPPGYKHDTSKGTRDFGICFKVDYSSGIYHNTWPCKPGQWPSGVGCFTCPPDYGHDTSKVAEDPHACLIRHDVQSEFAYQFDCSKRGNGQYYYVDTYCYSCPAGYHENAAKLPNEIGACMPNSDNGCFPEVIGKGTELRYGWYTGADWGENGLPILDSVDFCSKKHDNASWELTNGKVTCGVSERTCGTKNTDVPISVAPNNCILKSMLENMPLEPGSSLDLNRNKVYAEILGTCNAEIPELKR